MHSSIYNAILQYEEVGGDLVERIKALGLFDVFEPIITEYGADMEQFDRVLFYMIHCYSRESEFHVLQADWELIKKQVAEKVGIDTKSELYEALFYLKSIPFTLSVRKYLDYQNSKPLKHLLMLKDLYEQMVNSAIENITDSNGVVLFDQKVKNAKHAEEIYSKITEWEMRINEENTKLNKPIEQLKSVEKKKSNRFTLRMEDNLSD